MTLKLLTLLTGALTSASGIAGHTMTSVSFIDVIDSFITMLTRNLSIHSLLCIGALVALALLVSIGVTIKKYIEVDRVYKRFNLQDI